MTVQELKEQLEDLIEEGKADEPIRANIPGKGWMPLEEIGEYYGEIYLGLRSDLP